MARLTKQYLQDLEAYEYEQLKMLERIKAQYEQEGNVEKAKGLDNSIRHQMGRWGMLSDLLETFGIEEKIN